MYLYFTNNGSRSIKYSKHNIQQNKRVLSSKSSAVGVASDKGDAIIIISWWRGTVAERRSLAGELSLSCARPAPDG